MLRSSWAELKRLLPGGARTALSVTLLAAIAGLAEALALLLVVRVALDIIEDGRSIQLPILEIDLSWTAALVAAGMLALAALGLHLAMASLTARITAGVLMNARTEAIDLFVSAGWPTQAQQREGALQETVSTLADRSAQLAHFAIMGAANAISLAMFLCVALIVDPLSSIAIIVAGVLLVAAITPISRATRRRADEFVEVNSRFSEDVTRMASSSMELSTYGVQQRAADELKTANDEAMLAMFRARRAMLVGGGLYKDLAVLVLVACVSVMAAMSLDTIDQIGVVITLLLRALASAQAANRNYHGFTEGAASLHALRRRLTVLERGATRFGHERVDRLSTIEFAGVDYAYQGGQSVLRDVSLSIPQGEWLGVVGPSGGGKSTLMQVLLRLRCPTRGDVRVNGIDYLQIDDDDWRTMVAFVPQEPSLLEGTVRDNILFYRSLPEANVRAAARAANVLPDIERLPNGFDTMLGPRGSGLSGGQKQRIAIARALAGHPQLLVLDEPSSALDVRSEQLLHNTLDSLRGHTTVVTVAHRARVLESCDRIIVVDDGRVRDGGGPDRLDLGEIMQTGPADRSTGIRTSRSGRR
ncbi:MAG: ABC transporter ATP-binding protein [Actinomycetota bacterium]